MVYTAEKTKSDLAGKLSTELVDKVNAAIVSVKAALEGKDSARIRAETEKLQKVLGEAGSAAYQQTAQRQAQEQAGAQGSATGSEQSRQEAGGPGGEKVVDADFKVKDEK
jgi:molecular chaperone DnaK